MADNHYELFSVFEGLRFICFINKYYQQYTITHINMFSYIITDNIV